MVKTVDVLVKVALSVIVLIELHGHAWKSEAAVADEGIAEEVPTIAMEGILRKECK
ncbi:hypothetical protein BAUCODRAFT_36238 [Baudoinia panamericana UAMH 10762]|uniref:Uncharacterized protein n=1 Tax=Baudoinia panamericana (strain UAMH 10762) TaxID=717646 RepID=M2N4U8_BAUPA|nr:uncharacterized protein BAUCODRAFT_36238 [Baudoinia panamericana UAMH 10762]EMC93785.1 hypothetical protein BAUCODRAFT_36238 [Baudoinia panamericana UAMH 10762]